VPLLLLLSATPELDEAVLLLLLLVDDEL